jgi:hypothetical protein
MCVGIFKIGFQEVGSEGVESFGSRYATTVDCHEHRNQLPEPIKEGIDFNHLRLLSTSNKKTKSLLPS